MSRCLAACFAALTSLGAMCPPADEAVEPTLTIDTRALPAGTIGAPYSMTFAAAGGASAYSWLVTRGALPTGLLLDGATGTISGTPSVAGQFSFTVQAADGRATAIRPFTLSIGSGGPLAIVTGTLPPTTIGLTYTVTLQGTGGTPPYAWSLASGELPAGMTLNSLAGLLTGTPAVTGQMAFELRVQDGTGATVARALTLAVHPAPAIGTGALPGATVGTEYGHTLAVEGGTPPFAWIVAAGSLPPGLALNASTGLISGTPTAAGAYPITARGADAAGASATRAFSIAVTTPLAVGADADVEWTVGQPYARTLRGTGGTPPYTWRVTEGTPPPGIQLSAGSGALHGMPSVAGRYTFTVQLADAGAASATRALTMNTRPVPTLTSTSVANGRTARAYRAPLRSFGGTAPLAYAVSDGTLPPGLQLDAETGLISGTPTAAGDHTFTLRITDAAGAASSRQMRIRIQ